MPARNETASIPAIPSDPPPPYSLDAAFASLVIADPPRPSRPVDDSPIHTILPEILAEIFCILVSDNWSRLGVPQLRLVCSRWFEVVANFPEVWSYIHLHDGVTVAELNQYLSRSGSSLLNLDFTELHNNTGFDATGQALMDSRVAKFVSACLEHSERWHSAAISSSAYLVMLAVIQNSVVSFPVLNSLLVFLPFEENHNPEQVWAEKFPGLLKRKPETMWPNLKSLHLAKRLRTSASLEMILPGLRKLQLQLSDQTDVFNLGKVLAVTKFVTALTLMLAQECRSPEQPLPLLERLQSLSFTRGFNPTWLISLNKASPGIQSLSLHIHRATVLFQFVTPLPEMPNLTSLSLQFVNSSPRVPQDDVRGVAAVATWLPKLPQLVSFELREGRTVSIKPHFRMAPAFSVNPILRAFQSKNNSSHLRTVRLEKVALDETEVQNWAKVLRIRRTTEAADIPAENRILLALTDCQGLSNAVTTSIEDIIQLVVIGVLS